MAADIDREPSLEVGVPRAVFESPYRPHRGNGAWRNYDISPDGETFLFIEEREGELEPTTVKVVLNWFQELERLVPTP